MSAIFRAVPLALFAFLVGVFLASLRVLPPGALPLAILFSVAFFGIFLRRRSRFFYGLCVVLIGLSLGIIRFALWDGIPMDPILSSRIGTPVVLIGEVVDEPDVRETNTHLTIAIESLERESSMQVVSGTLLLFTSRYPEYMYGDRLMISGTLKEPKSFTEPDGRVFDYPSYLRVKDIRYQMSFAKVERMGKNESFSLTGVLFSIKHRFQSAIADAIPEPHSALLSGLLLGGKQSLGTEWLGYFKTAGVIHIVVLSGYNMTIVAQWLGGIFGIFGFLGSLSAGAIGIILFAIMTGGGATVVRAAILALLVLLARLTGRLFDMGRALLVAGALMVLVNPSILLFDPSFQLSFLASLGLVFVTPIVSRHVSLWKSLPKLREVLVSTLATQIAVLPLLLYQTGMLSLVSLPANLLVLPFIPLAMLLGFIAGVVAFFVPQLALIASFPAYVVLSYILAVAKHASQVPFASVSLSLSPIAVFVLYGILALFLWREYRKGFMELYPLQTTSSPVQSPEELSSSSSSDKTGMR